MVDTYLGMSHSRFVKISSNGPSSYDLNRLLNNRDWAKLRDDLTVFVGPSTEITLINIIGSCANDWTLVLAFSTFVLDIGLALVIIRIIKFWGSIEQALCMI